MLQFYTELQEKIKPPYETYTCPSFIQFLCLIPAVKTKLALTKHNCLIIYSCVLRHYGSKCLNCFRLLCTVAQNQVINYIHLELLPSALCTSRTNVSPTTDFQMHNVLLHSSLALNSTGHTEKQRFLCRWLACGRKTCSLIMS